MKLPANEIRERLDRVRDRLAAFLPIPSTEYGVQSGDWDNDDDWCHWLAGFGIRPTLITVKTLAGDKQFTGYEVVESIPVACGPADLEVPPEPTIKPLESFSGCDRAIAFMVGRAMDDWALHWLETSDSEDPLRDLPSFLKRQAK